MTNLIIQGVLFLIIVISGFLLKFGGDPYATGPLTIHKLLAVALIVILVLFLRKTGLFASMNTLKWIVFCAMLVFAALLLITGGIISAKTSAPEAMKFIHLASTVLFGGASIWLIIMVRS